MADCFISRFGDTGSGGNGNIKIVDSLPEIPDVNTLYEYNDPNYGSMLMMYINEHWRYSPLLLYPQKKVITPAEMYMSGHVFNTTPTDAISVVDLSEPIQIGNYVASQALKIYGQDKNNIQYGWTFNCNVPQNVALGEQYVYIGVSAEGDSYDYAVITVNNGSEVSYKPSRNTFAKFCAPLSLNVGDNEITVKYVKDSSGKALDDCIYIYGAEYLFT